MGVDSSSVYLGDDLSLHNKSSIFLSSMAYPTGSAGGRGVFGQLHHFLIILSYGGGECL